MDRPELRSARWCRRCAAVAGIVVVLAAGCSDDGGDEPAADTAPEPEAEPVAGPGGVECVNLAGCTVEVSGNEGVAAGDLVSVRIEGWNPEATTGVSQCEDAADPDNVDLAPGPDGLPPANVCNVFGLTSPSQTETSDAEGVIVFDYEVRAGERMGGESASGTCDAAHDCELVVFLSSDVRLRSDAPLVTIPLVFA